MNIHFAKASLTKLAVASAALIASAVLIAPTAAVAQPAPPPSYARPSGDNTIKGRITSIDGTFQISVRDDNGYIDTVALHQGTIINPTGLTLEPGMSVTIAGYNGGSRFNANEIDTPYNYAGPVPEPVFYGPGFIYPGYAYGYGPSFSLGFDFGGGSFYRRPFAPGAYYHSGGYERGGYERGGYAGHGYVNQGPVNRGGYVGRGPTGDERGSYGGGHANTGGEHGGGQHGGGHR